MPNHAPNLFFPVRPGSAGLQGFFAFPALPSIFPDVLRKSKAKPGKAKAQK